MASLFDSLLNPQVALGAGLLAPTRSGTFGSGLQQGIISANAAQRAQLRAQMLQSAILREQQQQAARAQQQAALSQIAANPNQNLQQAAIQNLPQLGLQGATQLAGLAPQPSQTAAVKNAIALGLQPGTPAFDNFVREQVLRPATQVDINTGGFKVPAGFMMADPNNPNAGVVPIPGGPATRQTPAEAAKTALTAGASELLPRIRNSIIPGGEIDRGMVATINANLPFTEGRVVRTQILDAIEAKLRAESGAAVPQTEVERAAIRFMPSTLDKDAGIADKLDRLEKFLGTTLEKSDPELFKRLSEQKTDSGKGRVKGTQVINGRTFMQKSGKWMELVK